MDDGRAEAVVAVVLGLTWQVLLSWSIRRLHTGE